MMVVSMLVIVPVALVRVDVMVVVGTDRRAKNAIQMIVEVPLFFGACHDNARQQDHAGEGGLHPDDSLETQTWLTNTDDV